MIKELKPIFVSILIIILIAQSTTAATTQTTTLTRPAISPDTPLYDIKTFVEDLQEKVTFNTAQRLLLKQQHLNERISELQYESTINYNRNSEKIIRKLQLKRLEIEEDLETLKPECIDTTANSIIRCDFEDANDTKSILYKQISKHNTEVLTNLLNSPTMPAASKVGLQNALNRSGVRISANQIQSGSYNIGDTSLLPFRRANFYDPTQKKWFSVVVNSNSIRINNGMLSNAEYTIMPNSAQVNELDSIAKKVNKQGRLSASDKLQLTLIWWQIKKI